jgi:hypothetical protein
MARRPRQGMKRRDELIRFLFEFADEDLKALAPQGWKDLRDSLRAFLTVGDVELVGDRPMPDRVPGLLISGVVAYEASIMTKAAILRLQAEAARLTSPLTDDGAAASRSQLPEVVIRGPLRISTHGLARATAGRVALSFVSGPPHAVFLLQAARLLEYFVMTKVKRCGCGRQFYQTGRQEHCSPACRNRRYIKEWRTRNATFNNRHRRGKMKRRSERRA